MADLKCVRVNNNQVVNSGGCWVGNNSGLVGATGAAGPTGATGPTGTTGANGHTRTNVYSCCAYYGTLCYTASGGRMYENSVFGGSAAQLFMCGTVCSHHSDNYYSGVHGSARLCIWRYCAC